MKVVFSAAVGSHHRQPAADAEPDIHMAQGPAVAAGVAEGDVPEFHLVVAVGPLFGGQAALVHGVGQVEEPEGGIQEVAVDPHLTQRLQQQGDAAEELGGAAHIPGDQAHIKGTAPGFEADKEVDRTGHDRREGLAEPEQQPDPALG